MITKAQPAGELAPGVRRMECPVAGVKKRDGR
jgi:hypothetical protein